jgi:hypothetical protein
VDPLSRLVEASPTVVGPGKETARRFSRNSLLAS